MKKEEYEKALSKIMAKYRDEVEALQDKYKKGYDLFKVGDLCRQTDRFRVYFKVVKIRHLTNKGDIYTLLDGRTTDRYGEEHHGSRNETVRDTEAKLIRPA